MSDPKHEKKKSPGKVIQFFTVEITDVCSSPELYDNPGNPYAGVSDDDRVRGFDSIFGLLLAESFRESGRESKG